MRETKKVIRWMVTGLMCAGCTTLIWEASMPKRARGRYNPREQALEIVNHEQQHLSTSQLQDVHAAELSKSDLSSRAHLSETYSKLPLSFEANNGQTDQRVKFLSRGHGYMLFLTSDEAVLKLKPA